MPPLLEFALFLALAAGFVGVALSAVKRIGRVHREHGDPARLAKLIAEARRAESREPRGR